ncbi:MAG: hypothetical protein NVSMB57_06760 [Actinomycetota bacterium]
MTAGVTQTVINRATGLTIDVSQSDHEDPAINSLLRAPEWQFAFDTTRRAQTPAGTPATKCSETVDNHGNSPPSTGTGTNTDYSKRTDAKMVRAEKVGTIHLEAHADGVSRPGSPIVWDGDVGFVWYDPAVHVGHMCILAITNDTRVTHLPNPSPSSSRDDIEGVTELVLDFPIRLGSDSAGTYQETESDLRELAQNSTLQTVNASVLNLKAVFNGHSMGNWHAGGIDFSKSPAVSGTKNVTGVFTTCPAVDDTPKKVWGKCLSDKGTVTRTIPFTFTIPTPAISAPAPGTLLNTNPVPLKGTSDPGATVQIYEGGVAVPNAKGVADGTGHWTAYTPLPDGNHTVTARVVDAGGASLDSNATSFTLDTTPPTPPSLTSPASGSYTDGTFVTFSGLTESNADVEVFEANLPIASAHASPGGGWSATATLVKGPHTVAVRATDVAGNVGALGFARSFNVTTARPVVTTPTDGGATNSTNVTFTGVAEPSAVVTLSEGSTKLGSTAAAPSGSWSLAVSLPEGDHTVSSIAMSGGFTSAPSVALVTVDLTPPAAAVITSPANGSEEKSVRVTVKGNSEPAARITLFDSGRLVGEGVTGPSGLWSIATTLSQGDHKIVAHLSDRAGNLGPDSAPIVFTVKDPLEIVTPREDSLHAAANVVSGNADPRSTEVKLFEGGVEIGHAAVSGGKWSLPLTFTSGIHSISVQALTAGVWGPLSKDTTFRVDADPPKVLIFKPAGYVGGIGIVLSSKIRGSGSDARPSDSRVASITLSYKNMITGVVVNRTPDECFRCPGADVRWSDRSHLAPGFYQVSVIGVDAVGNQSTDTAYLILPY